MPQQPYVIRSIEATDPDLLEKMEELEDQGWEVYSITNRFARCRKRQSKASAYESARRQAQSYGIHFDECDATGADDTITKRDVDAVIERLGFERPGDPVSSNQSEEA